jgi:hypothetical protein
MYIQHVSIQLDCQDQASTPQTGRSSYGIRSRRSLVGDRSLVVVVRNRRRGEVRSNQVLVRIHARPHGNPRQRSQGCYQVHCQHCFRSQHRCIRYDRRRVEKTYLYPNWGTATATDAMAPTMRAKTFMFKKAERMLVLSECDWRR